MDVQGHSASSYQPRFSSGFSKALGWLGLAASLGVGVAEIGHDTLENNWTPTYPNITVPGVDTTALSYSTWQSASEATGLPVDEVLIPFNEAVRGHSVGLPGDMSLDDRVLVPSEMVFTAANNDSTKVTPASLADAFNMPLTRMARVNYQIENPLDTLGDGEKIYAPVRLVEVPLHRGNGWVAEKYKLDPTLVATLNRNNPLSDFNFLNGAFWKRLWRDRVHYYWIPDNGVREGNIEEPYGSRYPTAEVYERNHPEISIEGDTLLPRQAYVPVPDVRSESVSYQNLPDIFRYMDLSSEEIRSITALYHELPTVLDLSDSQKQYVFNMRDRYKRVVAERGGHATDAMAMTAALQSALESDYGRSQLSQDYNNDFGIKARKKKVKVANGNSVYQFVGTEGKDYVIFHTDEDLNRDGVAIEVETTDAFRIYNDDPDGDIWWHYQNYGEPNFGEGESLVEGIQEIRNRAGYFYATDERYPQKLLLRLAGLGEDVLLSYDPRIQRAQWTHPLVEGGLVPSKDYGIYGAPRGDGSRFHTAVDLADHCGADITSPFNGVIDDLGRSGSDGYWVRVVNPNDGSELFLGHLAERPNVEVNQQVSAGDVIGKVGDTGNAKGNSRYAWVEDGQGGMKWAPCHTHAQLKDKNGNIIDPTPYLISVSNYEVTEHTARQVVGKRTHQPPPSRPPSGWSPPLSIEVLPAEEIDTYDEPEWLTYLDEQDNPFKGVAIIGGESALDLTALKEEELLAEETAA